MTTRSSDERGNGNGSGNDDDGKSIRSRYTTSTASLTTGSDGYGSYSISSHHGGLPSSTGQGSNASWGQGNGSGNGMTVAGHQDTSQGSDAPSPASTRSPKPSLSASGSHDHGSGNGSGSSNGLESAGDDSSSRDGGSAVTHGDGYKTQSSRDGLHDGQLRRVSSSRSSVNRRFFQPEKSVTKPTQAARVVERRDGANGIQVETQLIPYITLYSTPACKEATVTDTATASIPTDTAMITLTAVVVVPGTTIAGVTTVAPLTETLTSTAVVVASSDPQGGLANSGDRHTSSHSNDTGAIAGGTVGGVVGLVLIIIALLLVWRRGHNRIADKHAAALAREDEKAVHGGTNNGESETPRTSKRLSTTLGAALGLTTSQTRLDRLFSPTAMADPAYPEGEDDEHPAPGTGGAMHRYEDPEASAAGVAEVETAGIGAGQGASASHAHKRCGHEAEEEHRQFGSSNSNRSFAGLHPDDVSAYYAGTVPQHNRGASSGEESSPSHYGLSEHRAGHARTTPSAMELQGHSNGVTVSPPLSGESSELPTHTHGPNLPLRNRSSLSSHLDLDSSPFEGPVPQPCAGELWTGPMSGDAKAHSSARSALERLKKHQADGPTGLADGLQSSAGNHSTSPGAEATGNEMVLGHGGSQGALFSLLHPRSAAATVGESSSLPSQLRTVAPVTPFTTAFVTSLALDSAAYRQPLSGSISDVQFSSSPSKISQTHRSPSGSLVPNDLWGDYSAQPTGTNMDTDGRSTLTQVDPFLDQDLVSGTPTDPGSLHRATRPPPQPELQPIPTRLASEGLPSTPGRYDCYPSRYHHLDLNPNE